MKQRIILIGILLIAVFLRIYFALTCEAVPDFSDMAIYNEAALSSGISSFPPPGYPLFLRLIYSIFGAYNYKAVFVAQGILGALTVFLVYFVTRRISNATAALIAAGIAAIYPYLIAYSLTTLTETLTVLLVMLILCISVSSLKDIYKSILICVVIFLGYFVKPAMLFFVPGLLIGVKKRLVLLLGLAVTFGPLFIYGSITGKGEGRGAALLYRAYNPRAAATASYKMEETELGAPDSVSSGEYFKEAMKFISSHKWKTCDLIYRKASILLSRGWDTFVLKDIVGKNKRLQDIMMYGYLPIMMLGFIGLIRHYNRNNRIIALAMISYLVVHILITVFKLRYRLLIEPVLIMYAGILLGSKNASTSENHLDGAKIKEFFSNLFRKAKASSQTVMRESKETIVKTFRHNWDFLLIILCLALALRIYFALSAELRVISEESVKMNNLATVGAITTRDAPLYPLLLRFFYKLFGVGNLRAIYVIQGVINTATVFLIYILGSKLCTQRIGLIAAAIAAIYPQFLSHNVSITPTSFGIFITVLIMLTAVSERAANFKAIIMGILIGFAILLKPLYLFLLPGLLITAKKRSIILLCALILVTPLVIRNSALEREFVPVYQQKAWGIDFKKYEQRLRVNRAVENLYANAAAILRKDYQAKLESDVKSEVRNINYIYTYSYIIIMLMGLIGFSKYCKREHMAAALPVFVYIILLIFFSQLFNKPNVRFLWEPLLIIYSAMLLNRKCTVS